MAKQLLERVIHAEGRENGLRFTIVRPFNFIGPRMDFIPGVDGEGLPRVLACFSEALLRGQPLKLVDSGLARRTFLYIQDAVDAIFRILERPEQAAGQIFNVGSPENETTMANLAVLMIEAWEKQTGKRWPHGTETVSSEKFYGEGYEDCDRRVPDITQARELLGWEPLTSLTDTVQKTLSAYLLQYGDLI